MVSLVIWAQFQPMINTFSNKCTRVMSRRRQEGWRLKEEGRWVRQRYMGRRVRWGGHTCTPGGPDGRAPWEGLTLAVAAAQGDVKVSVFSRRVNAALEESVHRGVSIFLSWSYWELWLPFQGQEWEGLTFRVFRQPKRECLRHLPPACG